MLAWVSEMVQVCSGPPGWQGAVVLPLHACTGDALFLALLLLLQAYFLFDLLLSLKVPQYLNTAMVPEIAWVF